MGGEMRGKIKIKKKMQRKLKWSNVICVYLIWGCKIAIKKYLNNQTTTDLHWWYGTTTFSMVRQMVWLFDTSYNRRKQIDQIHNRILHWIYCISIAINYSLVFMICPYIIVSSIYMNKMLYVNHETTIYNYNCDSLSADIALK